LRILDAAEADDEEGLGKPRVLTDEAAAALFPVAGPKSGILDLDREAEVDTDNIV
jgi:hypothetical protein